MADAYIVAGLGNPGEKYRQTRHNVGFMAVDYLAGHFGERFQAGRGEYLYAKTRLGGKNIYLVKPVTFMNLSGYGLRQAVDYWKVELNRVLVIYDDFQLPFGKIRLRASGSDGGHKGMRSIIEVFRTEDIQRLRIGIGRDDVPGDAVNFVLGRLSGQEMRALPDILNTCADAIEIVIKNGIAAAMNRFNG